jgi:hypothetical protein
MVAYAKSVAPSYHEEQAQHNPPEDAPPPYEEVTADAPPPVDNEQQTKYPDEKLARGEPSTADSHYHSTSTSPPTSFTRGDSPSARAKTHPSTQYQLTPVSPVTLT